MTTKEELAPLKKVWGEDVKNQAFLMYLEPEKPSPSYIGDAFRSARTYYHILA